MEMVSFIVRTCGRPHVLKHCLESIRQQTYPNIEVVVVEDGENMAEQMIRTEFSDMNIKYHNTGKRAGRSVVGNIALGMAQGEYFNFLDDDDLIYPLHTEVLKNVIAETGKKVAYAVAHEAPSVYSKKKQNYVELYKFVRYRQKFNRMYLTISNYFPIQTVMFHRSLFEQYGGFREHLDALEDWDLWVRYASHEDFVFTNQVTSLYRVPFKWLKRDKVMYNTYEEVSKLIGEYHYNYNLSQCNEELNYILKELKSPLWRKMLRAIKKKIYSR